MENGAAGTGDRPGGGRAAALAFGVYAALAVAVFRTAWGAPTTTTIGGGVGDGALFMWFLRWTPFAIGEGMSPLVTDHLNWPAGVNVMWNTAVLLPGLLLAPFTLTLGPIFTFNLLLTLALCLSAWTAYLAISRFVCWRFAAWVGGLLYGFSPVMIAQSLGHLHVTLAFIPPLLFLGFHEVFVRQRVRPAVSGAVFGLVAAAQLLTGEELLASSALVCMVLLGVLVVLYPRHVRTHVSYVLKAGLAGTASFLAVTAWPIAVQFFGRQRVFGAVQTGDRFVSDLLGFIIPTRMQHYAPEWALQVSRKFSGNLAEWNAYVGLPMVVLVIGIGVAWYRRPVVRTAFVAALGIALLSLGPTLRIAGADAGVPLPWEVVKRTPVIDSLVANRMMLYVHLFTGLLVALFVDAVRGWSRGRRIAGAVAVLVAILPLRPIAPFGASAANVPAFFTGDAVRRIPRGSVALVLPYPMPREARPMLWQAEADMWFRMPGGYFVGPDAEGKPRFGPPLDLINGVMNRVGSGREPPELTRDLRRRIMADLRKWDVRTVIVGPAKHRDILVPFLSNLLGRKPQEVGGVSVWWNIAR